MKTKDVVLKVLVEFSRLLIGVVFIFSGTVKAIDPMGGAIKIGEYLSAFGLDFLHAFSTLLSINLSAIEFTLGVSVLLGVYRRYASFFTLVFMALMTPLTLYLALFDPVSDCGCFGDAVILTNWETFYKNVVLLAAAILLFIHNQRMLQLYTFKVYWFVALYAYLFCVVFAYWNYNHLPMIDFRPYKLGANIPELMSIPEGAPEDEYNYSFIYEKEGVKQEFSLEDIPTADSSWVFVDAKTTLVKKGYEPPVAAFNLYTSEDDLEVTDRILDDPNGVLLLIAPKLEEADDSRIDEIITIYDYALENKITFYGVTGSSSDVVVDWTNNTGAEYPFLIADAELLKTVIRSNPGLVLLKSGTILGKWHYKDIPEEEEVKEVMEESLSGLTVVKKKEDDPSLVIILTFTLPLLFVWMYDYFRNRRRKKEECAASIEEAHI
ncbi:BT_3928 family protein [Parabacteroides sp. PF5-9]|uniref:BT_3928 family protein n=1 Tax=Parabacteroides sp. PF5-9 TaxID=1742404 RepID=UPI0024738092|nr:BT_3928 family protein [Parabacteroides sp. PF5-9]